jgi:uncharacterized protein YebE (UPF0316 family)
VLLIVLSYVFVFAARVIDVSLATVRMLMVMRGRRLPAAIIGFAEVSIFILALSQVMDKIHTSPTYVLAYALGFSTGTYVGSLIEEKMAMGFLTLQVISQSEGHELVADLREAGYGVTAVPGQGRDGPRKVLFVTLKRKHLQNLLDHLNRVEPNAFTTILDTRRILGGTHPHVPR